MDLARVRLQPDPVARIKPVALSEHRDNLLAAEPGEYLDLRARRLDHDDLRVGAVVRDHEMLRSYAVDGRPAVCAGWRVRERELSPLRSCETERAIGADFSLQQIHRRR